MHQNHFWNLLAKHLSGEATVEEKTELEALIKAHPELSFPAQHVSDLWKLKGGHDISEAEEAFKKHMLFLEAEETIQPIVDYNINSEKTERRTKKFLPFVYVLTTLVLLSGAWAIWKNQTNKTNAITPQTAEVSTRPGSRTKLALPDGSEVWLNAGSKLSYSQPFGITDRIVTLTGEAFFDVVKTTKPFIIHTEGVQIKVLGTAFNVRSFPAEKKIETSLVRGRVEITLDKSPEKKYVLKPNEKLTLNIEENKPALHAAKSQLPLAVISRLQYIDSNTIAETSWVENKLVFVDESFEEVARKMERWYGVSINFKNEKVKAERFTGVFEKETAGQALQAIQIALPFRFTIKDTEITITQ
jgi:ferric-dicitrate binding protein FerR (iron transport regulator)